MSIYKRFFLQTDCACELCVRWNQHTASSRCQLLRYSSWDASSSGVGILKAETTTTNKMALQKKKYRCSGNRSRGGVPGKNIDTSSIATGNTKKDYGRQARSCHGANLEKAQAALSKQIKHRLTHP